MLQFAAWMQKYEGSRKEGDGSLLDNCMIVYGAGFGRQPHLHEDLPTLIAGRGGSSSNRAGGWSTAAKLPCAISS